jgi:pyruvate/2-oxoglutarate/acetoin dehydrogenase E1 component
VDAVVCTVGNLPLKPLGETAKADIEEAVAGKLTSQIDIVLQGMEYVKPGGSFTLISGIMARVPWRGGIGATIANSGIESFVIGAAAELGQDLLPGHTPVPASQVAEAFVRSVSGVETGKIFTVGQF